MHVAVRSWGLALGGMWLVLCTGSAVRSEAALTLTCASSQTVLCESAWAFEDPVPASTCSNGNGYVDWQPYVTTTNGTCPRVVTRTWTVSDYCGNTQSCSQSITLLDAVPPAALCSGINLVPNPSFESYADCPQSLSQVPLAAPWYSPSAASPDYFNSCTTGVFVNVPTNFAGEQLPASGQAYAGAIVYAQTGNDDINSYREYLQVPLIAPLEPGLSYRVSFRVSLSETASFAIAPLGAHFSTGPVSPPGQNVLPVVPQVVNPATNLLTSLTAWMLVEGSFIAAGGEDVLTLGNFLSDAATPAIASTGGDVYTYYYFDDIQVVADCGAAATGKTVVCGSPWTFDTPKAVDGCSGTSVTVVVVGTVTNGGCPRVITRTWSLADLCGNTNAWSQSVTLLDQTAPTVSCPCLQDMALVALSQSNDCAVAVPDFSAYTVCFSSACGPVTVTQNPPAGTLLGPGLYSVTVAVANCAGQAATCAVPLQVNAPMPQLTTPTNLVVVTCSNAVPVSYLVLATGNAGPVVGTPPSGSVFTQGTTLVTCTATSACGGAVTNTFTVTVKQPRFRWGCYGVQVGIGIGYGSLGGATTALRPGREGYPAVHVYPDPMNAQSGIALQPGAAEAITFTTVLDFTADEGSGIDLALPPGPLNTNNVPLLSFRHRGAIGYEVKANKRRVDDPNGIFKSIAVNTNGELWNSYAFTSAEALTNRVAVIGYQPGVTNCHVKVELNCQSGGIRLEFEGPVTPSEGRKGWDGCIYGPDRPIKKPKPTARIMVIPPVSPEDVPITELYLVSTGLAEVVFEEPTITVNAKRWGDGHVTLMKAYDDDSIDFVAGGGGGGVGVELGNVSNFEFRVSHFQEPDLPQQEQLFRMVGWPPGTTTNRTYFTNTLLLAKSGSGVGVDCYADFSQWGVTSVTLQLLSAGVPVVEATRVEASAAMALVTLSGFPGVIGCPGVGVLKLADTNGFLVLGGLTCGSEGLPCQGDELRIIAEPAAGSTNPVAFTRLEIAVSEDMDQRISGLTTRPAAAEVPVYAVRAAGGLTLDWSGEGFRVQGAETVLGPWYDLGPEAPATMPTEAPTRVFRLISE